MPSARCRAPVSTSTSPRRGSIRQLSGLMSACTSSGLPTRLTDCSRSTASARSSIQPRPGAWRRDRLHVRRLHGHREQWAGRPALWQLDRGPIVTRRSPGTTGPGCGPVGWHAEPMTRHVDAGPTPSLSLTGERTVPGIAEENYWFPAGRTLCELRKLHVAQERCAHGFVGTVDRSFLLHRQASRRVSLLRSLE